MKAASCFIISLWANCCKSTICCRRRLNAELRGSHAKVVAVPGRDTVPPHRQMAGAGEIQAGAHTSIKLPTGIWQPMPHTPARQRAETLCIVQAITLMPLLGSQEHCCALWHASHTTFSWLRSWQMCPISRVSPLKCRSRQTGAPPAWATTTHRRPRRRRSIVQRSTRTAPPPRPTSTATTTPLR